MRLKLGIIAMAAYAVLAPVATAQELWQGTRVGQTTADIKAAFPDVKELSAPAKYADGKAALLFLDQWPVAGEEFDVHFVMNGEALDSVFLKMSERETGKAAFGADFHNLEKLLSRRYGAPLYDMPAQLEDPGLLRMYDNQFQDGDLTIRIQCLMCDTDRGSIDISYSFSEAEDASGL